MGPEEEFLKFARYLKEKHPEITTTDIELAYTVQGYVEHLEQQECRARQS